MPDIYSLAPELRTANLYFHLDPCFEDTERCYETLGPELAEAHRELSDPTRSSSNADFIDHLLVDLAFEWCEKNSTTTLGRRLLKPVAGDVFCSVEKVLGDERIYEQDDLRLPVSLPYGCDYQVELHLQPQHMLGETGWLLLSRESELAVIGVMNDVQDDLFIVDPLIIGSPTFEHPRNSEFAYAELLTWYALLVFETLPEDIDEFAALRVDVSADVESDTSEPESLDRAAFAERLQKAHPHANFVEVEPGCLTGSLHVCGRPVSAAILLSEDGSTGLLTPDQLGTNDPRLPTLSGRTEDLLILQHSGKIDPTVREAIRGFLLNPSSPQRYCLLDGFHSRRILEAAPQEKGPQ